VNERNALLTLALVFGVPAPEAVLSQAREPGPHVGYFNGGHVIFIPATGIYLVYDATQGKREGR
jgi:hypothetical protein